MSQLKHTPGPWQAFGQRVVAVEMPRIEYGERMQYSRGYCVTQTKLYTDPDRETAEANARLIAAAPELLEACHKCEQLMLNRGDPFRGDDWQLMQDIRAAIAKAKGEQS